MNALKKEAPRALTALPSQPASLRLPTSYAKMANNELVELCKQQDQRAFAEIVKRHQRTVHGVLYRLAPDWSDTSDLAQEVFVRMWRCMGQLQNPARFRSWLYRIVMNLFYDELRKRSRDCRRLRWMNRNTMMSREITRDVILQTSRRVRKICA